VSLERPLQGRVALVTGAGAGIGRATAQALAVAGAKVALVDRDASAVQTATAALASEGWPVLALCVDVTCASDVESMVERTVEQFGALDILVNGVGGYSGPRTVRETSEVQWQEGLALNLTSTFLCCRAAIPYLIQAAPPGGRIINISSEVARAQVHLTAPEYAAGKAGVLALTRYLAKELGSYGVTVNAVAPGPTWSPRARRTWSAEQIQQITETTVLGRIAEPEDIAAVIVFLASPNARHVTGATIDVTGGHILVG